ncbi:MAG: hydrogenase iron-sulfur subunit [Deltaproteobacteria bacterium]|nr:hydrogenase iron-sulfur subunit [Deltaproteobacteria bacterium]
MCTGRVDLAFVLRAFQQGADGVIIAGCWPGECHYVTEGNYDALGNVYLARKLLALVGVDPARLRLEWIAASEGSRFAEVMSGFALQLRGLGPLGQERGTAAAGLPLALEALARLVPYLKLVERERLRVSTRTEEAYRELYESDEVKRLLDELVTDKLAVSQILLCLRERPLSAGEIAERLGLSPSLVSRHVGSSTRQGLVRYDLEQKRYALA